MLQDYHLMHAELRNAHFRPLPVSMDYHLFIVISRQSEGSLDLASAVFVNGDGNIRQF